MVMHLLWVDDEPWTIRGEIDKLDPLKYDITVASSVTEALRYIKGKPKEFYNLIIIDVINRPYAVGEELDEEIPKDAMTKRLGFEFAEIIRRNHDIESPLLFYTVVDDPNVQSRALSYRGTYVLKRGELSNVITKICGSIAQ